MPAGSITRPRTRTLSAVAVACVIGLGGLTGGQTAQAQARKTPSPPSPAASAASSAAAPEPFQNSDIDAQMFYLLLIGEMELSAGQAGAAYQVMLEAATRTKDEQLFRRATEIALQARAGEQALASAKAWRQVNPTSLDATRFVVQILVAMNRPAETAEPLRTLLTLTPVDERNPAILALPRLLARTPDRQGTATLVQQVLAPFAEAPATRAAARLSMGRAYLAAQDADGAVRLARSAQAQDPKDDGAAVLALEAMSLSPEAEPIVVEHLRANPDADAVRLAYAGALSVGQRYAEAATQIETVTARQPTLSPPLLTLGALYLELREPKKATMALERYVALVQTLPPVPPAQVMAGSDEDDGPMSPDRGLTRAWLLLAQAADQQDDFKGAEAWLAKVSNPRQALEVQSRRASILARQGKLPEARELIRRAPERDEGDARAKVLAEVQLLRNAKQWAEAATVLENANARIKDDVDLLYEQSMIADKLDRTVEMERLLRRVIELKPDHQHAYNALGYSFAERGVRLPEAKQLIQRALDLSPGDPFITDSLGWVEYRMGNRDAAVKLLRQAYNARPDTEIAAHLGEVLWANDQRDEARRVWREGRSRDAVNDVLKETLARLQVDL